VNLLQQNRDNSDLCDEENELREQLMALKSVKVCETRLDLIESKGIIQHNICKSEPKHESKTFIEKKVIIKKEMSDKKYKYRENDNHLAKQTTIKQENENRNRVNQQRGKNKLSKFND
jgi:hypothetical protein